MYLTELFWFAIYEVLGLASVAFVRLAGPLAIGPNYQIEDSYDSVESGKLNVAYRILAPVICCSVPVFVITAFCDLYGAAVPTCRFLPVVIYWITLGVEKRVVGRLSGRLLLFLSEAVTSVLIAFLFDYFVIRGYLSNVGIEILDNSSVAFQFELALFGVITCWISSGFVRHKYSVLRTGSVSNGGLCESPGRRYFYSSVDTSEAKLFEYEREFGPLLPERYKKDLLLRSLFFAIMAIEDGNRPKFIRSIERMMARFGLAKTTGIMQQKSDRPLSDDESVKLAISYVQTMWDAFLEELARSSEGESGRVLQINESHYCYDYASLRKSTQSHFSALYGDYCGTRCLKTDRVFNDVLEFGEREHYGLLPSEIGAPGSLCAEEFRWLSGRTVFWKSHDTIASCCEGSRDVSFKLRKTHSVSKDEIGKVTGALKDAGLFVLQVEFIESAFAEISCAGIVPDAINIIEPEWEIEKLGK